MRRTSLWVVLVLALTSAVEASMAPGSETEAQPGTEEFAPVLLAPSPVSPSLLSEWRSAEPESLARAILNQLSGSVSAQAASGNPQRERGSRDSRAREESSFPGAIVAVIFGVFGLLVVSRRRLR